jgi:xanthine dehydrogenase small subunit
MNGIWHLEQTETYSPKKLKEALSFLSETDGATILAGGTDLMVQMESGKLAPKKILNIWNLNELREIHEEKTLVAFGSLCTHMQILQHPATPKVLAQACGTVGAVQIQNRGTIGGNIANASPAGDTLPVLLALDASVEVASASRIRRIPFSEFYTGYRATALRANELITSVHVPKPKSSERTHFRKVGTRLAQAISKVVFCGRIQNSSPVKEIRLAFGSIGPTVIRLNKTEDFLTGKTLDTNTVDAALSIAATEIKPIDDIRSTAEYRASVVRNLLREFLTVA